MPTAARLTAAICLAVVAFILSGQIMPLMPESTDFGYFTYVNIVLGLACGWIVMGKRAGRGVTAAINNGLSGVACLIFWGLFIQAANEMVRLAMRNRYDGAFDALASMFQIALDWGLILLTVPIGITVLFGSVLSGLFTEMAKRKWR
ncbi:MAG: TrgA family protein [Sulfitobacter sp.]